MLGSEVLAIGTHCIEELEWKTSLWRVNKEQERFGFWDTFNSNLERGFEARGVVAEFGMEGLHLLHADIVGRAQFKFVHKGRWVEVDVVGEGVGL